MAVLVGIAILAAVIWWMNRNGSGALGSASGGMKRKATPCEWQRVDPEETRMLKEYRCSACHDVAYGRGENLPAARTCRTN
ncbi:MAG: hypothetical protein AAGI10_07945 [Pseudomonadota bacterium]